MTDGIVLKFVSFGSDGSRVKNAGYGLLKQSPPKMERYVMHTIYIFVFYILIQMNVCMYLNLHNIGF